MNKKISIILVSIVSVALMTLTIFFLFSEEAEEKRKSKIDALQNDLLIEESAIAKNDKDFYKVSIKKELNTLSKNRINGTRTYVNTIKKLLAMKSPDFHKLDKAMHSLLMAKGITRIDKIDAIWDMIEEIGFDSEEKNKYLLDSLSTLKPIELTQKLINAYGDIKNPNIKADLIVMLADNTSILNPEVQDKERVNFIVTKIKEIQLFLKDDVLKEKNPRVLEEGLYAYADISDEEEVQEVIGTLKNSEVGAIVSKDVFTNILTETAMATSEMQEEMLPMLLEDIKNNEAMNPDSKENFTQKMLDGINAGVFNEKTKQELGSYLKDQEPVVDTSNVLTSDSISKYYHWADALSKIKTSGVKLKTIALESDNPLKVSSILLYADDTTIQNIKEDTKTESLIAKLEVALEDNTINEKTKNIIKDAMARLNEKTSR